MMDSLHNKFKSSNSVEVESAMITRDEYAYIKSLEAENAKLKQMWEDTSNTSFVYEGQVRLIGELIHYPECWDVTAYPALLDAIKEIGIQCSSCNDSSYIHKQDINKIKAGAIREAADNLEGSVYRRLTDLIEYADKIEKGEI